MTEREDYEVEADRAEHELEVMEDESGKLGDRIEETRSDWERKVADDAVPGAGGDPMRADPDEVAEGRPSAGEAQPPSATSGSGDPEEELS